MYPARRSWTRSRIPARTRRGAGDPSVGANPPRIGGGAASLAPARQLTPQAEKGDGFVLSSVRFRSKSHGRCMRRRTVRSPPRARPVRPSALRRLRRRRPDRTDAAATGARLARRSCCAAARPARPRGRSDRGPARDRGRERDRRHRLLHRRRPQHDSTRAATTAPARSATCSAPRAPTSSTRRSTRGSLERWGERGKGSWITVYTNPGHAYVVDRRAALRHLDPRRRPTGPGWSKDVKAGLVNGPFQKRHFLGL